MGATIMEDDMSADMVADAALWALFAAAIGFLYLGCRMTKPKPKVIQKISNEGRLDRAA
jgi:hypothetical protein